METMGKVRYEPGKGRTVKVELRGDMVKKDDMVDNPFYHSIIQYSTFKC